MRKIFTSPRLENVEAVARLLEAEGIEVRIENGRALHRAIRGNFSYRDDGKNKPPQPEVWVIRSDDQPRARALMREAGLLQDTTRTDGLRFVPTPAAPKGNKRVSRLRYGLIALVLVVVVVNFIRRPDVDNVPMAAPPRAQLTMLDETLVSDESVYVIATPPLLALMLARRVFAATSAGVRCLAIDGSDPPETILARLASEDIHVAAASACPAGPAVQLNVHRYTTDGSGTGTVLLMQRQDAQDASSKMLRVRRMGDTWTVLASED